MRDLIVLEIRDSLTFIHRSSRSGEACAPATAIEEALSFASEDRCRAWVIEHGGTQPEYLALRYKSVAAALLDQAKAEAQHEPTE